jgi:glucokinase
LLKIYEKIRCSKHQIPLHIQAEKMEQDQEYGDSLSIGIEIGGTKIQAGIGTAYGRIVPAGIVRRTVIREHGASGILDDMVSMVDEVLASQHVRLSAIDKIGIGFGGPVDAARGVTLTSFQIDGWTDFPLRQWAEEQWKKPVFIENDASTAGLAEFIAGNGRGCSRLFYITVGSGVGGGWIVNGKIDNGQGLGAAEVGHMWVNDPESGEFSELEQICSGWAIGRRARLAAEGADSLLKELANTLEEVDARVVYLAAEQGDKIAARVLNHTSQMLGVAISNVVALLHPERVILGGGVSLMGPLFWDALQSEFRSRVMPAFASKVELVQAKLKEDVVVVGALCL